VYEEQGGQKESRDQEQQNISRCHGLSPLLPIVAILDETKARFRGTLGW
jgi:hypothetical protein